MASLVLVAELLTAVFQGKELSRDSFSHPLVGVRTNAICFRCTGSLAMRRQTGTGSVALVQRARQPPRRLPLVSRTLLLRGAGTPVPWPASPAAVPTCRVAP